MEAPSTLAGAIGHSVGALLFSVLTLLLLTSWRGRLQGGLLVAACAATLGWSVGSGWSALPSGPELPTVLALENLRNGLWAWFFLQLLTFKKEPVGPPVTAFWLFTAAPLLISGALCVTYLVTAFVEPSPAWLSNHLSLAMVGQAALAVAILALIEQVLRLTRKEQRWSIRYLVLAVGGILGFDFILYSDAILFRDVRPGLWNARGYIAAVAVPLLAITATRNPHWSARIFVSRGIVFHSTIFLAAGIYLLVMAGAGYYLRSFGGEWADILTAVLIFSGLVGLAALLLSKEVRSRLRLFLAKNFYQNKYEYGEEWLRFTETLAARQSAQSIPETVLLAFCDLMDVDGGSLWLREGESFEQIARHGDCPTRTESVPLSAGMIRFLEEKNATLNLSEPRTTPLPPGDVPGAITDYPSAWLVVPLIQQGELVALLTLNRAITSKSFNWEDRELLQIAGKQAAGYLTLFRLTEELSQARQFEAYNQLSAFLVHDLKNIVAQLELVVRNAKKHGDNPAFVEDAFRTVENAAAKVNVVLQHLRRDASARTSQPEKFSLGQIIAKVAEIHSGQRPLPEVRVSPDLPDLYLDGTRMEMVLGHLVKNAQEATQDDGRVTITAKRDADEVLIEVADNGTGMEEAFIRNGLFKPFHTTKGNAGMGIGVYEARDFAAKLGGSLNVHSIPHQGSTFTLRLPLRNVLSSSPRTGNSAADQSGPVVAKG